MSDQGAAVSSFPFDRFPREVQLAVFKRTDAPTMNAVRQVDCLRRKMVDENPFFFQNTRLIPSVYLGPKFTPQHGEGIVLITLFFDEFCKRCDERDKRIHVDFLNMKCVEAYRCVCLECNDPFADCENTSDSDDEDSGVEHHFPDTSGIIASTFEECSRLITRVTSFIRAVLLVLSQLILFNFEPLFSRHSYTDPDSVNIADSDDEDSGVEHHFPDTSGIIGATFEECSRLITRGARIGTLYIMDCHLTNEFAHSLRHLVDSSIEIIIGSSSWESSESLKSLLLEPKKLSWKVNSQLDETMILLDDEFFRCAGRGNLELRYERMFGQSVPVTDSQFKLLFGRNDLSVIRIDPISGITVEGLRQAVQALLSASTKEIKLYMRSEFADLSALSKRLESESVLAELVEKGGKMTDCFKYSYGDRRVTMHMIVSELIGDDKLTSFHIICD